MRSVFQEQPEVAHVYLGSKRHMMERIFNDENEPFWRSAKQMELGVIAPRPLRRLHRRALPRDGQDDRPRAVDAVLETTGGHPYATQELCYFLWEQTPEGRVAGDRRVSSAALAACCAPSTPTSTLIWDQASSAQRRHVAGTRPGTRTPAQRRLPPPPRLPGASTVQRALRR